MTGCEPEKIYINQTILSTQTVVSYATKTNITTSTATTTLPAITEKTTSTKTETSTQLIYTTNLVTNTETATKTNTKTSTITKTTTTSITTTTTIIPGFPSAPIPKYDAGYGAILGRVIYTNGNPADMYYVVRFAVGSMFSFNSTYTDQNGYYIFNNVTPDQYEIYVFESEPSGSISGTPNGVVTVSAGQITTVQNIIV
jgi:hypothetical protein